MCHIRSGSVFPVIIDGNELVEDLKDAIKMRISDKIQCRAAKLKLYLAMKGNALLSDSEPSKQQLEEGNVDDDINICLILTH
ncbi:hypothetical protein CCR75_005329 [Bremia lactucae]|uniref:Crinkler effector protein N-terminal domain-containing protein n=1 Tax=Bremia lactucae TaxID=4779 RepID=A0A976FJG5_BRELC|nr:hypothetical protein CCR75_005329 [Bremia lactucae]